MTSVRLALAAPTSTGTIRRPSGSVEWRPTKRRDVAGDVVLPAPFTVGLADTPPVIDVDPTEPGWAWQVVERVQGGSPKARYLSVPDVATVVDYADLVEVDGSTLDPVTLSNAWWAEVTAYAQPAGDYATNAALSTGLAGKVNSSTYTAGLAGKQDKATLGADVAADATVRAAFVSPSAIALIPLANYLAPGQAMPNDGVTDAAPLINTAMNDLLVKANGPQPFGPICYVLDLGPGRFRINSTIQPGGTAPTTQNQHVGITGAGRNQTFLLPYGAITAIAFNQINDTLPAAIDCHFSDFTIDLKNATLGPAGASRKGFIGRGWFDCTFTRLRVRNSPATAYGVDFPVRCTFTACSAVTTSTGVNGTLDMSAGPIAAAQFFSGFGLGFGVFDNESVTFDGCEATDCYRGGFFFEAFEASAGNTKRTAVIKMVGCRSWNNRIGVCNVGASGVSATNCEITDNTVAGYYGGVSGGTTVIASLATTLDNCQILRNGYGVYSTGDFTGVGHNYTALRDVLGGYRLLNNRIEDNVSGGIVVERFNGIEAGGLTVRGNHIRRNGGAGMVLRQAVGPVRDLSIEDNYFDANTGTALSLLIALNAPKITGNTFCNPVGGSAQALGVEWHPAEPVLSPLVYGNTFRRVATPKANATRLTPITTGDRIIDATADTSTPWTYREAFYGGTVGAAWPVGGDGWAINTGGSSATWTRSGIGIAKGGSGTAISYVYRDLTSSGMYVSSRITSSTDDPSLWEFIGVMHSLASSSARTAVVAGINGAGAGNTLTSGFYALWQVVGGTWTLLWESAVPAGEGHSVALARQPGSTVTDMFIDGKLVHTHDVTAVPATSLAGVSGVIVTNQKRYLGEFRAMPYAGIS
jgi:hypothetical protein